MWLKPADALAPERKLKLMLVTEETLRALAKFDARRRCHRVCRTKRATCR